MGTFVIPDRAAICREGKRIHLMNVKCSLHEVDALPSRFALAGHDSIH